MPSPNPLRSWAEGLSDQDASRVLQHAEACVANDDHPFWVQWRNVADTLRRIAADRRAEQHSSG